MFISELQSVSSPRRVAVPVLVKDGKPCSSGSSNVSSGTITTSGVIQGGTGVLHHGGQLQSTQDGIRGSTNNSHPGSHHNSGASPGSMSYGNSSVSQQQCTSSGSGLVSGAVMAAAYRNQNNFISTGHQQQCTGYVPLQGRAW